MDVDFNHPRIGRDLDHAQAWVVGRWIPLGENRHLQPSRRGFERGDQFEVVFSGTDRGEKYPEAPLAGFYRKRCPYDGSSSGFGWRIERSGNRVESPLMQRRNR